MGRLESDASVTGHADPDGEAPWAMQMVVRAEKSDPPSRTAACEAAAMAVVTLLADVRASSDWKPQLDRWVAGRIRKHCRRARGAKWEKAQVLDGVTVAHAGAQVRAYVPGPTDRIPSELARLQLSGLSLDDPEPHGHVDPAGPVLVVSVQPDPFLPDGKAAAACGHASQVAWMDAPDEVRARWQAAGFPVVVEQPDKGRFDRLVEAAPVVIRDAGFTSVAPGTITSVARWA